MSDAFKCTECHMTFGTVGLLQKHKKKFCVGGSLGDPDNLMLRKGLYSADTPKQRPLSPDDRDYPHYNPNQEAQLRQLAENHGRQMEYLQIKNKDLEKQREDIRRRLEQLGHRGPGTDNNTDLLAELRAQEERNQRALNDLRRQLYEMGHKRVNVIEVEKPMNYPQPIIQQAPPPPPQETGRKSYIYPIYFGSSLVAEITAMRQAYLQNGGNDPDVLAQLSQMQAEAQKIEDEMKNAHYDNRHREKKPDVSGKMTMIELENERLHKELMLLQEQNFLTQTRRKSDREDELERELQRIREEQLRKMMELQNEIALLKQRAMFERRPEPQQLPPPAQPKNAEMPWLLQRPYVDVEPMQPYDQYPNRYVPTGHHTWVSTQHDKMSRQVPPTARPEHYNESYEIDEVD